MNIVYIYYYDWGTKLKSYVFDRLFAMFRKIVDSFCVKSIIIPFIGVWLKLRRYCLKDLIFLIVNFPRIDPVGYEQCCPRRQAQD